MEKQVKELLTSYKNAVAEYASLLTTARVVQDESLAALVNRAESKVTACEINLISVFKQGLK